MPSPNALAGETSPYLLQHAHNPVDWRPWNAEALELARRENRPILLSVGYSACHWCHVMAHESFEDPETASLMNEHFVNIKVDREERPDLDRIYQTAHQLLAQRPGGWPLTMFLSPQDQTPFFGGTYFPREARFGLPGFGDLLVRVADFYREHQEELREQNASLRAALAATEGASGNSGAPLSAAPLEAARHQIQQSFDPTHGGFGPAPKFPHPTNLERLLRHHLATAVTGQADEGALHGALFTLSRMALGGIYDQVGGGFCRYSTDERWMIPHFEKMLYDNGPLLALYSEAWQISADPLYRRVVWETAKWVMDEMQSPDGGYYSSLDADSEGHEGRYYVWQPEEVRGLLTEEQYAVVSRRFGLDRPANFEGRWHLHVYAEVPEVARKLGLPTEKVASILEAARARLYRAREARVRPGRDDKILTAWNGLMIRGMATAGRVFEQPKWTASAEHAVDFIRGTMWQEGRLLATSKDGRAHLPAYLDDYAFLIDGLLALLQTRWRISDLTFARELADALLDAFEDRDNGGFFFTAHDHEHLIHRPKPFADEAIPAGNGIAAQVLQRLGHLLGETRYLAAAERTLQAAWPAMERLPYAHNALLTALEEHLYPPRIVILRGRGEALEHWTRQSSQAYAPRQLTVAIPGDAEDLPPPLADKTPQGEVVAYVCEGFQCGPPITDQETFKASLTGAGKTPAEHG